MKQIIRLTESDLHNLVKESVNKVLSEMNNEGTSLQNDFIRSLCKRRGIEYDSKYDKLPVRDASGLITLLKKLRLKNGEQPPTIDQLLQSFQQAPQQKPNKCAFNKYEDVTPEMVNKFWSQERYAVNLVDINNIRPEFQPAYEKAKKNVAMLDYAMMPSFTIYFDRNANLNILVNTGASWSIQNHLHHYAEKCKNYFKLYSAAWSAIDDSKWELLYNGRRR
jgi:hypothetical protein